MRINNQNWKTLGRRIIVLLLLCGLLLPVVQYAHAASIVYTYTWIQDKSGLPADDQWHDYFIAWEDTDDDHKWWFTDYHWFTADGKNNYDAGGSHWMEYRAISTLTDWTSSSFTSNESMGHMQIKYAGIDKDVVSVGVLSRVEIWSKEKWLDNGDYDNMDEIAEHMAELGFGI